MNHLNCYQLSYLSMQILHIFCFDIFDDRRTAFLKISEDSDIGDSHPVKSKGSGLIAADNRDGTECFYGREASDDGIAACHALDTDGEGDRDDGR